MDDPLLDRNRQIAYNATGCTIQNSATGKSESGFTATFNAFVVVF